MNERHMALRIKATQAQTVERITGALQNHHKALVKDGVPEIAMIAVSQAIETLLPVRRKLLREMKVIMKGTPIADFVKSTLGLADSVLLMLGTMPALEDFTSVKAAFKYLGLHVEKGRAVKREKGKKLGFDVRRRSIAIVRIAEPMMKTRGLYRFVYDDRKAHTQFTHPPMIDDCEFCQEAWAKTSAAKSKAKAEGRPTVPSFDCAAMGGIHWTDGHRHADALRVLAKAIVHDLWRISRNLEPLVYELAKDSRALQGGPEFTEATV